MVRERHRGYELIDGFKRPRAARTLGWPALWVHVADVRGAQAKVQILHSNRLQADLRLGLIGASISRDEFLARFRRAADEIDARLAELAPATS